jgi:dihydroorotate dehydrogenase (fumarate)
MDLSTTYLEMRLPHPLVVGAGPLGDDLDTVKALEYAGAAILVLRSLYEEEITSEQLDAFNCVESYGESFSEAASFKPESTTVVGTDEYLTLLRRVKSGSLIPDSSSRRAPMALRCTSITPPATYR